MTDRAPVLGVERSERGRKWIARADDAAITVLQQQAGLDRIRAGLLAGRGVSPDQAQSYLAPSLKADLPDPSVLTDMDKAVGHILDAIEANKRITLFSDYDVDGGTSAAQMIRWGRAIGYDFGLHVPDRVRDGYGPSRQAFEALKAAGSDLVVTLDCGAAAHDALNSAQDLDLPIIVIDHHLMDGLPPAEAIVNPNRPDDESGLGHLAAAGVTFMLIVALNREAGRRGLPSTLDIRTLLGLTAFGTVCDVVPMVGLNRTFVRQGLKVMDHQQLAGLNALSTVAEIAPPYTPYHFGYVLGPRINAGGRIGKSEMGAELLSTDDPSIAHAHAFELDRLNRDRRTMQDDMVRAATEQAERQDNRSVIVASMEGWHPGIIGIVAGRLKDRFERPAIVIGIDEDGVGKGSGRSIKGVDLGTAFTEARKAGLLEAGGGHAMAGGLTIRSDAINAFAAWLEDRLGDDISEARKDPVSLIDGIVSPGAVDLPLIDAIESVGPYGPKNPSPVFVIANVRISYAKRLKGGHIRFTAQDRSGSSVSGILFRGDDTHLGQALLDAGQRTVHLLGRVKRNRWQGRESADFQLTDFARAD